MDPRQPHPTAAQANLILQRIDSLPTLPTVAVRLLSLTIDDSTDLAEISRIIEADPSLSAKILGLCRRSATGLGDRITTVHRAVTMLGLDAVRSAALSVTVFDLMNPVSGEVAPGKDDPATGAVIDRVGLWRWAIGVGCASRRIAMAHTSLGIDPEEAFVAGLVHDLGKVALDSILPKAFARAVLLAKERGTSLHDAEVGLLPVGHRIAGKRLAEHWSLPERLRDVMWLCEHAPEAVPRTSHRRFIGIVASSRVVARALHLGWSGDFHAMQDWRDVASAFGLNPEFIDSIVPELHDDVAERANVLGLDEVTPPELLYRSILGANRELARLNERSHAASTRARVRATSLRAIASFLDELGATSTLDQVADAVSRSAACLLGIDVAGLIVQESQASGWRVLRTDSDNAVAVEVVETPPAELDLDAPGQAPEDDQASVQSDALEELMGVTDQRHNLSMFTIPEPGGRAAMAAIVHRGAAAFDPYDDESLHAVRAVWARAIGGALERERAREQEERLAAVANTLAKTREQLVDARSMVRLGRVAAGAAHEMNTPLAIISGRAQLLAGRLSRESDLSDARAIVDAAEQLSGLISGMHTLAEPPEPHVQPCQVQQILADAVREAERRTDVQGCVRVDVAPDIGEVLVDAHMLARAVVEPLVNAIEAVPGEIVETRAYLGPGDGRLIISVDDRGPGMSVRARTHAFDPFFSEKPAGRQTGLGLARARVLVEQHGGSIRLEPRDQGGTSCVISLPRPHQSRPDSPGADQRRGATRAA